MVLIYCLVLGTKMVLNYVLSTSKKNRENKEKYCWRNRVFLPGFLVQASHEFILKIIYYWGFLTFPACLAAFRVFGAQKAKTF